LLDSFCLSIILLILTKQVNFIVILRFSLSWCFGRSSRGTSTAKELGRGLLVAGEGIKFRGIGSDMLVPSCSMGVFGG